MKHMREDGQRMKKYRLTAWILICILMLSGCGMVGDTKSEHEPKIFGATYMTRNNPYFDVLHEAIEEVVEANEVFSFLEIPAGSGKSE